MATAAKLKDPRFKLPQRALEGRMRALGQKLTAEAQAGPNVILTSRKLSRGSVAWSVQGSAYTKLVWTGRDHEHAIIVAQSVAGVSLMVGFTEEWITTGQNCIFYETRLRFYICENGEGGGPPAFRLEWSGYDENAGDFVFPGAGAGHPHWQFGLGGRDPFREVEAEQADEIAAELGQMAVDDTALLLKEDAGPDQASDSGEELRLRSLWKRLHFPANAAWATTIWDPVSDPAGTKSHAWSPISPDHIDNWVISAVRYVANEFGKYAV
ncbi:MAG: hypothetical protein HYU62_12895 [Caulobacterales bacterium]|nr:hypothetical protein [Caulobacterales bacterium]